jgi:hypothetical protein
MGAGRKLDRSRVGAGSMWVMGAPLSLILYI